MLDTPEQIRVRAPSELVQAPEARLATAAFFDEALRLRNVPDRGRRTTRDVPELFSPELGEFMRQETLLLVHDIVWNRDCGHPRADELASHTFVNDPLAELYGITAARDRATCSSRSTGPPTKTGPATLSQAQLPDVAVGTELRNSPEQAGQVTCRRSCCAWTIPPPDPDAEFEPARATVPGQTLKDLLEMHMENDGCRTLPRAVRPHRVRVWRPSMPSASTGPMDNGSPIDDRRRGGDHRLVEQCRRTR